jgi:hypothetical protein
MSSSTAVDGAGTRISRAALEDLHAQVRGVVLEPWMRAREMFVRCSIPGRALRRRDRGDRRPGAAPAGAAHADQRVAHGWAIERIDPEATAFSERSAPFTVSVPDPAGQPTTPMATTR